MKFVVGENGRNPVKNIPRPRFVHHETHMEGQRRELGTPAVGGERLTACATRPPYTVSNVKFQLTTLFCRICHGILKWLLPLLTEGSVVDYLIIMATSFKLNFSFLNRISLVLISKSYPVVMRRVEPFTESILPDKFLWYRWESNPGSLGL